MSRSKQVSLIAMAILSACNQLDKKPAHSSVTVQLPPARPYTPSPGFSDAVRAEPPRT